MESYEDWRFGQFVECTVRDKLAPVSVLYRISRLNRASNTIVAPILARYRRLRAKYGARLSAMSMRRYTVPLYDNYRCETVSIPMGSLRSNEQTLILYAPPMPAQHAIRRITVFTRQPIVFDAYIMQNHGRIIEKRCATKYNFAAIDMLAAPLIVTAANDVCYLFIGSFGYTPTNMLDVTTIKKYITSIVIDYEVPTTINTSRLRLNDITVKLYYMFCNRRQRPDLVIDREDAIEYLREERARFVLRAAHP